MTDTRFHAKRNEQETRTTAPQETTSTSTSRVPGRAHNYDEAPPGQPGPDFSAKKPVFTRGPSVMDQTAVTSAAATPAGEIPNPLGIKTIVKGESRQRESHLPDLDILQAEAKQGRRASCVTQPRDEIRGDDEFGSGLSRAEVEAGSRSALDNWQG